MLIEKTELDNVYEIQNKLHQDARGTFVKIFHKDVFIEAGLTSDFQESYYSTSNKSVIRGMHFQLQPYDHEKLVYVTSGEILDVAVNVTKGSKEFGKFHTAILTGSNSKSIYIGKGYAHGFLTLSDEATVVYLTSTVHNPECDTGILWDSFGFDWLVDSPIVSDRDSKLPAIDELFS